MRRFPMKALSFVVAVAVATLLPLRPAALAAQGAPQAVYITLADSVPGTLDDIVTALRAGFTGAGWEVLAAYPVGVDRACSYQSRVVTLHSPRYARAVMGHGLHAAFAVPLRLAVFQDEAGTHVSAVNPHSVNRTIVAEQGFGGESEAVLQEMSRIVAQAVGGTASHRAYGQVRRRGLIGRTMGIMAGGPFPDKIETVHAVPGGTPDDLVRVADQVWAGLRAGGSGRWQARGAFRLDLPEHDVVVLGVSGSAMEARAFQIVGAGGDASRESYRCPGIAHSPAFPIEVVVMRDSGRVRVTLVDEMYRMKMYFEDAGRMKFAANMGMPGSIEDEIRGLIATGIGARR